MHTYRKISGDLFEVGAWCGEFKVLITTDSHTGAMALTNYLNGGYGDTDKASVLLECYEVI